AGGPKVRKNVTEEIGRDDHVEAIRIQHEARAQDIDVLLVPLDIGIKRRDFGRALVPPWHADRDAVALCRDRDLFLFTALGEVERKFEDAFAAVPREDGFLQDELAIR